MPEHESQSDLGPKPDARIEPGEPNPGGADASPNSDGVDCETADTEPLPRDLDPDDNPTVDDTMPEEVKEPEDTSTEATKGEADDDNTGAANEADRGSPA